MTGGDADPTRCAMGDDVDRVKTVATAERGGNLLRHRAGGVKEDRLDLGAQVVKERMICTTTGWRWAGAGIVADGERWQR